MRFETELPDAPFATLVADGFFKGEHEQDCIVCGERTHWFQELLGLYFCSTGCYADYEKARRAPDR